jgi:hypothetical protein
MSNQLSHQEVESLLGAYALDAVDPDEANIIELHLRDCPRCQAEVAEHRETAALLAHSGQPAPSGVWDNIVANLEDRPPRPAFLESATVTPIRRWRPRMSALVAVAAAIMLVVGGEAWFVSRQSSGTRPGGDGLDTAIIAAYADPHSKSVRLESSDKKSYADVVLLPNGTGFLVRNNLPRLTDDRTYQLWGNVGTALVSLGVLGTSPAKLAFAVRAPALAALAITEEQAGGVVVSKNPPVLVGALATANTPKPA